MAFKYQALNESRSSLASLSSLGSTRSIDSSSRQRPRLEFSAAGTTTTGTTSTKRSRNSAAGMAGKRQCTCDTVSRRDINGGKEFEEDGESESFRWTQRPVSLMATLGDSGADGECVREERDGAVLSSSAVQLTIEGEGLSMAEKDDSGHDAWTNSKDLHQNNSESGAYSMTPLSGIESETGLYIHSSVRSGSNGLRFSRQVSSGESPTAPLTSQPREHGKLFKVLQKFSNKRAQQRVELEAEKRARKSPRHVSGTDTGREKENVVYNSNNKRWSYKNKQGGKGRFPVSKSNDVLSSGFSDVVCRDRSDLEDSRSACSSDGLLLVGLGGDDVTYSASASGGGVSYDHSSYHGQSYLGMSNSCETTHTHTTNTMTDYNSNSSTCSSSKYLVSVKRSNSLNENTHHDCSTDGRTFPNRAETLPQKTTGVSLMSFS